MPSSEEERDFLALLADVLEEASVAPGDDFRNARLWGSLTAFALKVSIAQKYARDLELREICACSSASELFGKVRGK